MRMWALPANFAVDNSQMITVMKKLMSAFLSFMLAVVLSSCGNDEPRVYLPKGDGTPVPESRNILIAYFSWGGTTRRMANQIAEATGGTLFEIEPENPYPTEYGACTDVALAERDSDARPAINGQVENWDDYNVIFIGCPVWWHIAPMIINTFAESYSFKGKLVVPFCTYASTYRDETLQRIVELTADASHLPGLGLTSSSLSNQSNVTTWLQNIDIAD